MKELKKLPKGIWIEIPPIRLFLEDVKAIEEVYKEHFKTYNITTDEYELESAEELTKIGREKLSRLSFESSEPHIHVEFYPTRVSIYSSNDDVISAGIVSKLKNILDKRITPLGYLAKPWLVLFVAIVLFSFLKLFPMKENEVASAIMALSFFCISLCWVLWGVGFKHSVIYLKTRSSRRNFFLRNKDQILLSIFSVLLGAAISFLLLWATGNLKFR